MRNACSRPHLSALPREVENLAYFRVAKSGWRGARSFAWFELVKLLPLFVIFALTAQAAELSLKDVDGAVQRPLADVGQAATVLFFVLHDCPIANAYAPEISRIAEEFRGRGVRAFVIYREDDFTPAEARMHAREYAYRCPALLDSKGTLARAAGATVSPEAAVFSAKGALLYRGRIDDRVISPGKHRAEPHERDLRAALEAILAGKPVRERFTRAIGCYLPRDSDNPAPLKP